MNELRQYIMKYAERGACTCGRCAESIAVDSKSGEISVKLTDPVEAAKHQPTGHTADVGFFKVKAVDGASADELKRLVQENKKGDFGDVDVFDGVPHDFMELGGWIGDQGLALMLIGLGGVLGLWNVFTAGGMVALMPKAQTNAIQS